MKLFLCLSFRYNQRKNRELLSALEFLHAPVTYLPDVHNDHLDMPSLRAYLKNQYTRLFGDEEQEQQEKEAAMELDVDDPVASTSSSFNVSNSMDKTLSEDQLLERQFDLHLFNRSMPSTPAASSRFTLDDEISNLAQSGNMNPRLKKLQDALRSVPATSVDCERAFSSISRYLTKFRNRMSDPTLDSLCFAKHYVKKAGQNKEK